MNQQIQYIPQMRSISDRINNPVRLVKLLQAHNEAEFINLNLKNCYDEFDKILVIEGAVQSRPNSTEKGWSIDGTTDLINDFKKNNDSQNKVQIIRLNKPWKHLEEIKQTFIDLTRPDDILIIQDADEFYLPEDLKRVRLIYDLFPHTSEIIISFLHFYGDFKSIAKPGPEWNPQHQRIIKHPGYGSKYNSHPVLTAPDGQCTYFSPYYQHRRVVPISPIHIWHYGYARNNMDQVMEQKKKYYEQELVKHNNANKKFDEKIEAWYNNTEPTLSFNGRHPKELEQHPGFDKINPKGKIVGSWSNDPFYSNPGLCGNIWLCMTKQSQPYMNFYHNGVNIEYVS